MANNHYKDLVDRLFDGVYFVDTDRRITYWNQGAKTITGYSQDEVLGTRCSDGRLVHVDGDGQSLCGTDLCPAAQAMRQGRELEATVFVHHKQGHRLPVKTRIIPMRDEHKGIVGAMELFQGQSSTTQLLRELSELEQLALIDPLTEIGNRRYLEVHLRARQDEMQRYDWRYGLLFCDIDRFKRINDTFGHQVGDEVIRMVARTLQACIRPFDMIGRWGGEEFLAIVTHVQPFQLLAIAERLRSLVQESVINHRQHQIRTTISIGATIARPGDTSPDLLERADRLLYRSKAEGTNRVSIDGDAS